MARTVSLVILIAIVLAVTVLFCMVMFNFLIPMFLALLLVVMFGPLHRWITTKCKGHHRIAAGLTTAAILLIALIPMSAILVRAGVESVKLVDDVKAMHLDLQRVSAMAVTAADHVGIVLDTAAVEETIRAKLQEWLTPLALRTPGYLGSVAIGAFVMIVSLYYFLADGPGMIHTVMRLSPLEDKYEEQLIRQFDGVSRAVVVATLLSAFTQGMLAGIGYYFAGVDAVFLLIVLTMMLALIPFVGAAAVWVPVCLWLYFISGRPTAAILLAIYGAGIVSMADNVIKPLVLHGQAKLHPLLALLSVLGGVTALGPIGIFVGPMVVAFLQTVLNMLHSELDTFQSGAAGKAAAES